jgi:kinesin family protein 22
VPRPHFAALPIQPPPARLAPAVVQAISTAGSGSGPSHPRPSLVPVSRSHRMSSLGGGNAYQAFGINGPRRGLGVNDKIVESEGSRSGSLGFAMTEKDIDDRVCYSFIVLDNLLPADIDPLTDVLEILGVQISKAVEAAVEAEVARRLADRERERAEREKAEEIEVAHALDSKPTRSGSKSPEREHSIPSGVITPLLKRHRELDDELKSRLQELEQK